MRKLAVAASVLLMAAACVLHSPLEHSYAALGRPGSIVVTIDMEKAGGTSLSPLLPSDGIIGSLADKADRLSLELVPSDTGFTASGIAEGDYSYAYINSTLLHLAPGFRYMEEGRVRYYASDSLEAGVAAPGVLLFSDDYVAFHREAYSERIDVIPEGIADGMEAAAAAVYSLSPESLPEDLPIEIPSTVVAKMDMLLLLIGEDDSLTGLLDMDTEDSARTLVTLLRNELIKALRTAGEKPDFKELAGVFSYEGDKVYIDYSISGFI